MSKESKTPFVMLGLLVDGSKSGYDLKKIIEKSIGYFWQESYGQIYPVLKKLHQNNYVTKKTLKQNNKPDKNMYSITASGKTHLELWLSSPMQVSPERNELLLRTFFGPNTDIQITVQMLENHLKESIKMKSIFLEIKSIVKSNCVIDSGSIENSTFSMITLEYGIMNLDMQIKWAKSSIKTLEEYATKKRSRK
ncbi:MAG: PadR family transcriptional regulator [Leptospirales bacterium]